MTELKPCPFCGSDDVVVSCDGPFLYAYCQNCDAVGHDRLTEERAIKAWNTRHTPKPDAPS